MREARLLRWVWLVGLLAGCQTLSLPGGPGEDAQALWERGQLAMHAGQPEHAVALYEESLRKDDKLHRNHLSLATAHIVRGETAKACGHLALFLDAEPEHETARLHYAELLMRRGRLDQARDQFELVLARAQEQTVEDFDHLLHCHGRLAEIAEAQDDTYLFHLQRGIGLYQLARNVAKFGDEGPFSAEALWCKSAAALQQAHNLRPDEARPCWYLHAVWRRLAQSHQADRWLREAQQTAASSYLSPAEQRSLQLTSRCQEERLRP